MLSRQREWQLKKREKGLCVICGKEQCKKSKQFCETHYKQNIKRSSMYYRKKTKRPFDAVLQKNEICIECSKKKCNKSKFFCKIYSEKYRERYRNTYRKKVGIPFDAPLYKRRMK